MAIRITDFLAALFGLVFFAVPLAIILLLVWRQDGKSPFYVADRSGLDGRPFRMVKIRSMVVNADRTGVESTGASDARITPLGHFIRRWKIDELGQLWNVLTGDMSLVGPRPNTISEVASYAEWERELLSVRPGITDFSSIVFADEGEILKASDDPDADYARLIRPWKSALGVLYAQNRSLALNVRLIGLTVKTMVSRDAALRSLQGVIGRYTSDEQLLKVSRRQSPLDAL